MLYLYDIALSIESGRFTVSSEILAGQNKFGYMCFQDFNLYIGFVLGYFEDDYDEK